jgi:hypothetical protein
MVCASAALRRAAEDPSAVIFEEDSREKGRGPRIYVWVGGGEGEKTLHGGENRESTQRKRYKLVDIRYM